MKMKRSESDRPAGRLTNNDSRSTPTYRETVAIAWRILWQGIGGFVLAWFVGNLLVVGLLPELTRTGPSPWALAVPLAAAAALTLFILLPWVVRSLVTKPFGAFRLSVIRETPPAFQSATGVHHVNNKEGEIVMTTPSLKTWLLAAALATIPVGQPAIGAEGKEPMLHLVSGTLSKLDLATGRGLLTTDLGRPIYFDVPKAYLFENVTVGARIALRLDEYGRAVRVMDTSIPDLVGPDAQKTDPPIAVHLPEFDDR